MGPRRRALRRLFTLAFIVAAFGARSRRLTAAECTDDKAADRWIVAFPAELEKGVRAEGVEVWDRDEGVIVGGATASTLKSLADMGVAPELQVHDDGQWIYLLSHAEGFAIPGFGGAERHDLTAV